MRAAGLVLAAGAGRRMGMPKALLSDPRTGVPLPRLAAGRLEAVGCAPVVVVLGAAAGTARDLLGTEPARPVEVVVAEDWAAGLGASLRRGLEHLAALPDPPEAVLVTLADLPDVDEPVLGRVLDSWRGEVTGPAALVRATYAGRPGHPVLLGRDHWAPLAASAGGDTGAQPYLARRRVHEVSCDDLASGRDLDRPEDLGEGPAGE